MTDQSNEIDIVALQQEAEAIAHAEYDRAYQKLEADKRELELKTKRWRAIVELVQLRLNRDESLGPADNMEAVLDELTHLMQMARDFQAILQAIDENEILKSQWDKLLMSMRLVQP